MDFSTVATRRPLVDPTETAAGTLSALPADAVALRDETWLLRQQRNAETSLVGALAQLEAWGALPYLRAAARGSGLPDVPRFNDPHVYKILDSDIYKWLEAAAVEHVRAGLSPELATAVDEVIDLVLTAQRPDGSVHSWVTVHGDRPLAGWREGHELYCGGHLIQAAVAWFRANGDRRLLDVASRFVDMVLGYGGAPEGEPLPLHPGLEMALVELFRATGERRYLDAALRYIDRRGHGEVGFWRFSPEHFVDDVPVRQAYDIRGHAVMSLFFLCGVVDAAVETRDRELLAAVEAQWDDMVASKLYVTGGAGSRHHDEAFGEAFELGPDTAYAETCAAVASVMLSWRLLLATGRARYAELIERTVYNGALAGVSLDGASYLYVNPLHVRRAGHILSPDGYHHRKEWYECACCPPNLMRLVASFGQMVATGDPGGIELHQLVSSVVRGARGRVLDVESDVPSGGGGVVVEVAASDADPWTLRVRVPSWSTGARVRASWSAERPPSPDADGWLVVRRAWRPGDRLELQLDCVATVSLADPRVDACRGQVVIERGPYVYCLEEGPTNPGLDIDSVEIDPDVVLEPVLLEVAGVPTPALRGAVRRRGGDGGALYRPVTTARPTGRAGEEMTFLPYATWGNSGPVRMRVWLPVG